MAAIPYSNTEINRFWLQIIGDDSRIILETIYPNDIDTVKQINEFIGLFDTLLDRAWKNLSSEELYQLNQDAFKATQEFRAFLLSLLKKQVTQNYFILLKPGIINNWVTLSEEYLHLLNDFLHNNIPSYDPKFQDIFWLPIFIENARYIAESIGSSQSQLRDRGLQYALTFQELLTFSIQLQGIYRIGESDFPIAKHHRFKVTEALRGYSSYLSGLIMLVQQNRIPGSVSLLYLDRTNRMFCYCISQLSHGNGQEKPPCDPTKPRISNI